MEFVDAVRKTPEGSDTANLVAPIAELKDEQLVAFKGIANAEDSYQALVTGLRDVGSESREGRGSAIALLERVLYESALKPKGTQDSKVIANLKKVKEKLDKGEEGVELGYTPATPRGQNKTSVDIIYPDARKKASVFFNDELAPEEQLTVIETVLQNLENEQKAAEEVERGRVQSEKDEADAEKQLTEDEAKQKSLRKEVDNLKQEQEALQKGDNHLTSEYKALLNERAILIKQGKGNEDNSEFTTLNSKIIAKEVEGDHLTREAKDIAKQIENKEKEADDLWTKLYGDAINVAEKRAIPLVSALNRKLLDFSEKEQHLKAFQKKAAEFGVKVSDSDKARIKELGEAAREAETEYIQAIADYINFFDENKQYIEDQETGKAEARAASAEREIVQGVTEETDQTLDPADQYLARVNDLEVELASIDTDIENNALGIRYENLYNAIKQLKEDAAAAKRGEKDKIHTLNEDHYKEYIGYAEQLPQTRSQSALAGVINNMEDRAASAYSIPSEEIKPLPKTTVDKTNAAILEKFGKEGVARVTVAANPEAAGLTDIESTAAGVVIDGKPYLFTDNIAEGNELGILLHEVGVHVGMPTVVGQGNYKFLINKIKEFAKANDGSRESQLAKRASERVTRAGEIVDIDRDDELIAYFVEEAVNSGVNPSAERIKKTKLGIWFRRFIAGAKNLLNKLGFKFKDSFNAQELVDIAYGSANFVIRNPEAKLTKAERAIQYGLASPHPVLGSTVDMMNSTFSAAQNATPVWSQNMVGGFLNAMSKVPSFFKDAVYRLLSLRQMADTVDRLGAQYKPIADGLRRLNTLVNERRFAIDQSRLSWQSKLLDAQSHKEGYTEADIKEFSEIAHESTIEEIDLRNENDPEVTKTDLYKRYRALVNRSSDLSKYDLSIAYNIMANAYEEAGESLLKFYTKVADPTRKEVVDGKEVLTAEAKKELGFITDAYGRIVPYFPLVREGSWWVDYKVGNEVRTLAFETEREAKQEVKKLEQDPEATIITRQGSPVYKRTQNDQLADVGSGLKQLNEVQRAVEKTLEPGPERDEVIALLKDTMLKAYPASSLKKQFKKREGRKGFRQDVFQNFGHMGLKFSNELALLDNINELDNAIGAIEQFGAGKVPPQIASIIKNVQKRAAFMRNPTPGPLYSKLSMAGYSWFILGNISSAIVNLTQIPIVTYGLLAGEFGPVKAVAAIKDGFKAYFKFHKDDNTKLELLGVPLADRTAFGGDFMSKEMQTLFDVALSRGIIRRTTSQELQEAKFGRVDSLTGKAVKVEMALGYVFQNSERANREVSLLAAYKLAKEKYGNKKVDPNSDVSVAMERAFDIVEQANGPALAEAGPEFFQDGWGKVIGTFKRFALSQLYLQYKLLRDMNPLWDAIDNDPKIPKDLQGNVPSARALAFKQFSYISGSAWLFAGAKGLPVYGAAEIAHNLAQMALGDDDDDLDLEFNMKIRKQLGDMTFRGPLSHFLDVDLASRTGFYGLMYRDDPYRRAEVGDLSYLVETLAGPVYAIGLNGQKALDKFNEGDLYGAIQSATPSFIRNVMKGVSLATEGAVNSKGVPIVEDISGYNAMMQILGFTPTRLSNAYQANEFLSRQMRKVTGRRSRLLLELNLAKTAGDFDGEQDILDKIEKFNQVEIVLDTNQRIGGETIGKSWKSFNNSINDTVRGLRIPRKLRPGLIEQTGIEDPDD